MKTTLIISQEYKNNTPAVFMNIGNYYVGDLTYPRSRNFPPVEYWSRAMSSDTHRGFKVLQKNLTDMQLKEIIDLQLEIEALGRSIPVLELPYIPKKWKIKSGRAYEQYQKENTAQYFAREEYTAEWGPSFKQLEHLQKQLHKLITQ